MKTDVVQIRISPELKAQLRAAAEEENRTVSSYIETLIKKDLAAKATEKED